MKQNRFLIAFLLIVFTSSLSAQNFVDSELNTLAKDLATKLDQKNNYVKKKERVEKVLVVYFTDTEGKVSKLGAKLSEEFSVELAGEAITFSVTPVADYDEEAASKKGFDIDKTIQGAKKVLDGTTKDNDYEQNMKNYDNLKKAEGSFDIYESLKTNESGISKNFEAVITGTLTELPDHYNILIKVISTEEGNTLITSAKGKITKTPFIRELEKEENIRRQAQTTTTGNATGSNTGSSDAYSGTYKGSAQGVIETNLTRVELLEARQVGQKIECSLRITNIGPDVDFTMYSSYYRNKAKAIDANNSYDYYASQVLLGDKVDNVRVTKTLVTNTPVSAKVTFDGAARDVQKLAKFTVSCYGHGGDFEIEFRDVLVK